MQREFKFLLTEKNNPIGIKIFPNSPAIYENVVDFPNDENTGQDLAKRDEYINKFLFNNRDYKTLFESIPKQSNFQLGVQSATFEVRYETYKNLFSQDVNTLKNKDYAILEIKEVTGPGVSDSFEYYFFQVECIDFSKSEQGTFTFQGQLDIWTTNAEKIKAEHQVLVNRAHVDRIKINENNLRLMYIYDENTLQPEPKFNGLEANVVTKEKTIPISTEWIGVGNSESEKARAKLRAQRTKWAIVYYQTSSTNDNSRIIYKNEGDLAKEIWNEMLLNTKILIFPLDENIYFQLQSQLPATQQYFWGGGYSQEQAIADANVKSIHVVDNLPINILRYFFDKSVKIDTTSDPNGEERLVFMLRTYENDDMKVMDLKGALFLKRVEITQGKSGEEFHVNFPYSPVEKTQEDFREILNETKLYTSFHMYYILANINTEEEKFSPEFIDNTSGEIYMKIYSHYSFLPEKLNLVYTIDETNNYNLHTGKGSVQADVIELPISSNKLDEYYTQHKISSKASLLTGSALILGGATLGSRGKGVIGGGLALIGGRQIFNEFVNRGDLNRAPKEAKNVTSNPTILLTSGLTLRATLFFPLELKKGEKQSVFDYYTMCGYSQKKLMDFNKAKLSRFYFNYLEVDNFFNSLSGNLNSSIKQQLDNDLQDGIRVWHYRSFESFKGFMNYTYENIEMSLLTFNKDTKKWELKNKNGTRESK